LNAALACQELGRIPDALGHFSLAFDLLTELVERNGFSEFRPELARAFIGRGAARRALGHLQEARADLKAGVSLMRQVVARANCGERAVELARGMFLALGERPKARQTAAEAVQILQAEMERGNPAATPELLDIVKRVQRAINRSFIVRLVLSLLRHAIGE
jgi:tetratricopeptide (TPR) repeat protein